MSRKEIETTLVKLAGARFKKDLSNVDAAQDFFEVLGIDSYQAMELLTELEEKFDTEIPDYEMQGVHTFSGLAEVIERRL